MAEKPEVVVRDMVSGTKFYPGRNLEELAVNTSTRKPGGVAIYRSLLGKAISSGQLVPATKIDPSKRTAPVFGYASPQAVRVTANVINRDTARRGYSLVSAE